MLIELEDEGPIPHEAVPCMVMTMHQGKMNQFGKVEYMGCVTECHIVYKRAQCKAVGFASWSFAWSSWGGHCSGLAL